MMMITMETMGIKRMGELQLKMPLIVMKNTIHVLVTVDVIITTPTTTMLVIGIYVLVVVVVRVIMIAVLTGLMIKTMLPVGNLLGISILIMKIKMMMLMTIMTLRPNQAHYPLTALCQGKVLKILN